MPTHGRFGSSASLLPLAHSVPPRPPASVAPARPAAHPTPGFRGRPVRPPACVVRLGVHRRGPAAPQTPALGQWLLDVGTALLPVLQEPRGWGSRGCEPHSRWQNWSQAGRLSGPRKTTTQSDDSPWCPARRPARRQAEGAVRRESRCHRFRRHRKQVPRGQVPP